MCVLTHTASLHLQKRVGNGRDDPLLKLWEQKVVDLTLGFAANQAQYLQVYVENPAAATS